MEIDQLNLHMGYEAYDYQIDYCGLIDQAKVSGDNVLITMPTGMGKTLALYYASNLGKTLYVTPIRALSNEKLEEIPRMFPHLSVLRDTGADRGNRKDFNYVDQDLIITTNERLLSMLNTNIQEEVMENVEYIVIDEIHLIGDINRGSALEWVIMSLKRYYPSVTIVGLSATLPNYKEFAKWLQAVYYYRPAEDRPIPLEFYFDDPVPYDLRRMPEKRRFKFNQLMRWQHKFKEQFLVFLSSKRDIETYAKRMAGLTEHATLEDIMKKGVAFHHADINEDMKDTVLDEFKAGNIRIIFCSPTLAMGVNLPATNCVIFDLSFWNDIGYYHELLPYDKLTQMFGRAGRLGYSDVGRVIMLGQEDELSKAQYYVENEQDTNSQFGRVMVDKVLNMIVNEHANTIEEIEEVVKTSFWFYQNPQLDTTIITNALTLLEKYRLIKPYGPNYFATSKGKMVTKLYISVHTVIDALHQLRNVKELNSFYDFFRIFLGNDEFLASVPFDERTDFRFIEATQREFRDSKYMHDSLLVNVYDKDENTHIIMDKSEQLQKIIALMFNGELIPKLKIKPSKSTLMRFRRSAEGLVARLGQILSDELKYKIKDTRFIGTLAMALKYGSLDERKLELYSIKGFGEKTIELLVSKNIDTKEKLFNTPFKTLKFYGFRPSEARFKRMKDEWRGIRQTSLDW